MSKYIIWDFDGTLAYREGLWTGTLVQVLRQNAPACNATADMLRPHLQTGYPWHQPGQPYPVRSAEQWWDDLAPVFERAFIAVGIAAPQASALAREVRHAFVDLRYWHLFGETIPTLGQLSSQGWTHMILSNHVPELSMLVSHLGLDSYIARIFNSAETGYEKPHPLSFRRALDAVGDAERMWMIGDSIATDVQGAEAAGIPAILVHKRDVNARHQCDNLSQVTSILQREASQPDA